MTCATVHLAVRINRSRTDLAVSADIFRTTHFWRALVATHDRFFANCHLLYPFVGVAGWTLSCHRGTGANGAAAAAALQASIVRRSFTAAERAREGQQQLRKLAQSVCAASSYPPSPNRMG